ncbi:MAG: 16S rRNA (guanine(527)-N(7))-methyltransferase RsmG [Terriglobales bacterium]
MDSAALLAPFVPAPLSPAQLAAISTYVDLLLRWNQRLNLTAVRQPEQVVTRHIGESLFAAAYLLPDPAVQLHTVDVGSGAGFPGLPLKLWAPNLRLTLIEAQHKKATFLREVARALRLADVEVFAGRAENYTERGDLVTFRAVERFEAIVPLAAGLLRNPLIPSERPPLPRAEGAYSARLAMLIGASQVERARALLPSFTWEGPQPVPLSTARVVLVGKK